MAPLSLSPSPLLRFLDFALDQESAFVLKESVVHKISAHFSCHCFLLLGL